MINTVKYPILDLIDTPDDLRLLSKDILPELCDELRQFLLKSVSKSSGHFASGLGVIEITVALHYIYKTPFDNLIWDVGHQAYPHKILTGRRNRIDTIRKKNGLHPFPWRDESEYDVLSVGHSSTSISASLGMAIAAQREGINRKTVCVIGDGAITAGIAFEAMNHAGDITPKNMLVILNDNDMSISENVGALNNNLNNPQTVNKHTIFNKNKKKILCNFLSIKKLQKKTKKNILKIILQGTMFKELGFNYIGPVDGHNVISLVKKLKKIRNLNGPQLLHILTKKGCGYKPAEKDPITWHAVPRFDPNKYSLPKIKETIPAFSKIFGDWLCEEAKNNDKLIAITPAMCEGSGMTNFSKKYPNQYFDVAIAEQHAVTFAAGLAIKGYKPIVVIYSTFLQRSYDQIIHDIAIQKLPIMFAIDRAGVVGGDGQTHQGSFDISFLRCIPEMIIMTPSDENECRLMLHTGYHYKNGPTAVRYPKGYGVGVKLQSLKKIPIGKGIVRRHGRKIAILCFGTLLIHALKAAKKINATVVDMRFAKPIDKLLILEIANKHDFLVTLEENSIIGGAGSGVNEFLLQEKKILPILNLGLPDFFIPQGTQEELIIELGLDYNGIIKSINNYIKK